jgi:transglutaminase-like putative cysteine protease
MTRNATMHAAHGDQFLQPTRVIDWTNPDVRMLATRLGEGAAGPIDIARRCFQWVRDEIGHTVDIDADIVTCSASQVLSADTGFCYAKSHLLAALLRANGIPAGLCYQRLAVGDGSFGLHGLAAVLLPDSGWYRIDPRGNKPGVNAQFTPPVEQLAFPIAHPGERLFPGIYPDPAPPVVRALTRHTSARLLAGCLPDASVESDLELPDGYRH